MAEENYMQFNFASVVLLAHYHTHLFTSCLWLFALELSD